MTDQTARAEAFLKLHVPGDPVVIFNAWDAGSARAVAAAGARAIGTGSWSVAAAHGYADGEKLPLELAIANLARIVAAVDLPVSIDLEAGYGPAPDDVARSVTLVRPRGRDRHQPRRWPRGRARYPRRRRPGRADPRGPGCGRPPVRAVVHQRPHGFLSAGRPLAARRKPRGSRERSRCGICGSGCEWPVRAVHRQGRAHPGRLCGDRPSGQRDDDAVATAAGRTRATRRQPDQPRAGAIPRGDAVRGATGARGDHRHRGLTPGTGPGRRRAG